MGEESQRNLDRSGARKWQKSTNDDFCIPSDDAAITRSDNSHHSDGVVSLVCNNCLAERSNTAGLLNHNTDTASNFPETIDSVAVTHSAQHAEYNTHAEDEFPMDVFDSGFCEKVPWNTQNSVDSGVVQSAALSMDEDENNIVIVEPVHFASYSERATSSALSTNRLALNNDNIIRPGSDIRTTDRDSLRGRDRSQENPVTNQNRENLVTNQNREYPVINQNRESSVINPLVYQPGADDVVEQVEYILADSSQISDVFTDTVGSDGAMTCSNYGLENYALVLQGGQRQRGGSVDLVLDEGGRVGEEVGGDITGGGGTGVKVRENLYCVTSKTAESRPGAPFSSPLSSGTSFSDFPSLGISHLDPTSIRDDSEHGLGPQHACSGPQCTGILQLCTSLGHQDACTMLRCSCSGPQHANTRPKCMGGEPQCPSGGSQHMCRLPQRASIGLQRGPATRCPQQVSCTDAFLLTDHDTLLLWSDLSDNNMEDEDDQDFTPPPLPSRNYNLGVEDEEGEGYNEEEAGARQLIPLRSYPFGSMRCGSLDGEHILEPPVRNYQFNSMGGNSERGEIPVTSVKMSSLTGKCSDGDAIPGQPTKRCGSIGSGSEEDDEVVPLPAVPVRNYSLSSVEGDCEDEEEELCTVKLSTNKWQSVNKVQDSIESTVAVSDAAVGEDVSIDNDCTFNMKQHTTVVEPKLVAGNGSGFCAIHKIQAISSSESESKAIETAGNYSNSRDMVDTALALHSSKAQSKATATEPKEDVWKRQDYSAKDLQGNGYAANYSQGRDCTVEGPGLVSSYKVEFKADAVVSAAEAEMWRRREELYQKKISELEEKNRELELAAQKRAGLETGTRAVNIDDGEKFNKDGRCVAATECAVPNDMDITRVHKGDRSSSSAHLEADEKMRKCAQKKSHTESSPSSHCIPRLAAIPPHAACQISTIQADLSIETSGEPQSESVEQSTQAGTDTYNPSINLLKSSGLLFSASNSNESDRDRATKRHRISVDNLDNLHAVASTSGDGVHDNRVRTLPRSTAAPPSDMAIYNKSKLFRKVSSFFQRNDKKRQEKIKAREGVEGEERPLMTRPWDSGGMVGEGIPASVMRNENTSGGNLVELAGGTKQAVGRNQEDRAALSHPLELENNSYTMGRDVVGQGGAVEETEVAVGERGAVGVVGEAVDGVGGAVGRIVCAVGGAVVVAGEDREILKGAEGGAIVSTEEIHTSKSGDESKERKVVSAAKLDRCNSSESIEVYADDADVDDLRRQKITGMDMTSRAPRCMLRDLLLRTIRPTSERKSRTMSQARAESKYTSRSLNKLRRDHSESRLLDDSTRVTTHDMRASTLDSRRDNRRINLDESFAERPTSIRDRLSKFFRNPFRRDSNDSTHFKRHSMSAGVSARESSTTYGDSCRSGSVRSATAYDLRATSSPRGAPLGLRNSVIGNITISSTQSREAVAQRPPSPPQSSVLPPPPRRQRLSRSQPPANRPPVPPPPRLPTSAAYVSATRVGTTPRATTINNNISPTPRSSVVGITVSQRGAVPVPGGAVPVPSGTVQVPDATSIGPVTNNAGAASGSDATVNNSDRTAVPDVPNLTAASSSSASNHMTALNNISTTSSVSALPNQFLPLPPISASDITPMDNSSAATVQLAVIGTLPVTATSSSEQITATSSAIVDVAQPNTAVTTDDSRAAGVVTSVGAVGGDAVTAGGGAVGGGRPMRPFAAGRYIPSTTHNAEFIQSLSQLKECGWYWGPLGWEEAEAKLSDQQDGSFLVRDSSDEHYILSLSFRSQGATHHTRIEHYKGQFSFYSQPKSHGAATIIDFVDRAMEHSRSGKFLYFLRPRGAGNPPAPVQLLYPVSRFARVQSLQHACRFEILKHVRRDHIVKLPLPHRIQEYLLQTQYYTEFSGTGDEG